MKTKKEKVPETPSENNEEEIKEKVTVLFVIFYSYFFLT